MPLCAGGVHLTGIMKNTDSIRLYGIRAWGKHGVTEEERDTLQPFDVEVELDLDLPKASSSDELNDTVDYALLHKQVVETVQSTSYKLLERLAGAVLDRLLVDSRIRAGKVTISKPERLNGATAAVTLRRINS